MSREVKRLSIAVAVAAAWWVGLLGLWLLLVSGASWPELLSGMGAATIGTAAMLSVARAAHVRFHPRARWLGELWRIGPQVFVDTGIAARALGRTLAGRPSRGRYVAVGPIPVAGSDARASARRALLTIALSLPPNSIVVAFDKEQRLVLVHQLLPKDPVLTVRLP
ncbi:MAG: hypothetical protein ACRDL8_14045 [Solirubrobacteraceae bacterium]